MMTWVKNLICGSVEETTMDGTQDTPPLSRQEMSELFSDELARPVLQKRTRTKRRQPRRLMAGRQSQFA